MPIAERDDDLIMTLVEETLQTPPEKREERLRKLCQDPSVYQEVCERVRWEERMGRFLLDPLFERTAPGDPFAAGNLVGGRFRILRKVGYGGMGVVFEAVDEKLERRVALKCARPGHRQRLPPEARAAREVSHYNVCKVHDLHTVETPAGEIDFLSMEFIEGGTLSERIRTGGPMPDREAREIAAQICAGLAQAHRQGVVHGDLKCANILLTASREGRMRAVITDFGMAKMAEPQGGSMMSGRGGTFDYMAPELLLGGRATAASDLYALGVMFHIMLKGHSPERENPPPRSIPSVPWNPSTDATTLTMAQAILSQAILPGDWRRKVEDLPAPWNRVVNRCLEARPLERFPSAGEVEAAFAPTRSKVKWGAVPAAALVVSFGYWYWNAQPTGTPVRLAVLPIVAEGDTSRAAADIGMDVADRLAGARRRFTVISPRETLTNHVDTPEKAKQVLGATHALEVHLRPAGSELLMQASVSDLDSGRSIGKVQGTYPAGHGAEIAKAILATVTGAFQLRVAPKESVSGAAYVPYVQAMDLMRQDSNANAQKAIPLFEQAAQLDPGSALPWAGLAEAQITRFLRHDGPQWLEAAGQSVAKAKSVNSDSVRVLLASGDFDQQHGRYEEAIRQFSRVTQLEPANADGWRRLAGVYENNNRDTDAVATYRKAIEAQPSDYRLYITLGNFYFFRNQFSLAEQQYRKVIELAPWLASGHMNAGLALIRQGRLADAEQALSDALKIRSSPILLMNLGGLRYLQERYADAAGYFEQSIASGGKNAIQYRDLGDAYRQMGRVQDSVTAYREGLAMAEDEVARNPRDAAARARMALLSAFLGDKRRAAFEISQALAMQPDNPAIMREAATT
ncbi:MAG TPA: protein kinase, partial [Bryobacteraceae bacterium]